MKTKLLKLCAITTGIYFFTGIFAFAQESQNLNYSQDFNQGKITELIFSVDPRTNEVNKIFLKKENPEKQLYELKSNCYRCDFYRGNFDGTLKMRGNRIINSKKGKFTIHTFDNLMPGQHFLPGEKFQPGTKFSLAGIKTTVLTNQKGIFIVESN